jgi:hypothetical protein
MTNYVCIMYIHFISMGLRACLKTYDTVQYVMLDLFQHLIKSMAYETLK